MERQRWLLPKPSFPKSLPHSSATCRILSCSSFSWPSFSCRGPWAATSVVSMTGLRALLGAWVWRGVCWFCVCLGATWPKITANWSIYGDCCMLKIWLGWAKLQSHWYSSWVFHSTAISSASISKHNLTMLFTWPCGLGTRHSGWLLCDVCTILAVSTTILAILQMWCSWLRRLKSSAICVNWV